MMNHIEKIKGLKAFCGARTEVLTPLGKASVTVDIGSVTCLGCMVAMVQEVAQRTMVLAMDEAEKKTGRAPLVPSVLFVVRSRLGEARARLATAVDQIARRHEAAADELVAAAGKMMGEGGGS